MADSQRKSYNLFDVSQLVEAYPHYVSVNNDIINFTINSALYTTGINVNIEAPFTISCTPVQVSSASTNARIRLVFNDDSIREIYVTDSNGVITEPKSITYQNGLKAIRFNWTDTNSGFAIANLMINSGDSAKPYEPYGWVHSLRKLTTATEAVENPLYSDGTAITAYTLKGSEEHTGTPTPSNPVEVNGVGERTENLLPNVYENHGFIWDTGEIMAADDPTRLATMDYSNIFSGNVTCSVESTESATYNVCLFKYDKNKNYLSNTGWQSVPYTYDVGTERCVRILVRKSDNSNIDVSTVGIMLNTGSTDKPYEPYGYKIPISTLQGSAVNYLGSVQSYREIAKYIFDGTDNLTWIKSGTRNFSWFFNPAFLPDRGKESTPFLCSHGATVTTLSEFVYGTVYADNTYNLGIFPSELSTVTELRQWLATQYANGTPVTIWYSLYTPTTATVNEPLMKIGTYADSISNAVSIPTTDGANSITVDTTVQPSEFSATWSGWHNAYVKEYDGSDWQ